ncbi:uncharacterized protein LOC108118151 [Drosophila eugracilis]|uniref:uncharacterized protein LOC108118151 n=1 Tax=Drosophila eugracilis TaxID=29029 RepID=UPI0007E75E9B|nr:uncharacterized protein LOC108118151 [Drosophila eugracilis]
MSEIQNSTTAKTVIYEFAWPLLVAVFEINLYRIILELVAHILLIVITVVVVKKCWGMDDSRSGRHAQYSVVGLFLCLGETLLVSHSWWLGDSITQYLRNLLHMLLGMIGLWLGVVGIFLKSVAKTASLEVHFCSKHGLTGLIGLLLVGGSLVTGLTMVYYNHMAVHLSHRLMGIFGFVCLCSSQWLAFNLGFARREWKNRSIKWLKIGSLGATIAVVGYEFLCLSRDITNLMPTNWFKAIGLKSMELNNPILD